MLNNTHTLKYSKNLKHILFMIPLFLSYFTTYFCYAETGDTISNADWTQNPDATAQMINNAGKNIGIVYAKQGTKGVLLRLNLSDLQTGIHGMHFHNIGDCTDHAQFQTAGGHIDAHKKPHGFLNLNGPHEGNLPNLIIDKNGMAHVELYTEMVSVDNGKIALLDDDGSTLIIHEKPDDHQTQPIGGAGGRIACGVFKKFK